MARPSPQADRTGALAHLPLACAVALAYFLTARASLSLTVSAEGLAIVWPPSGVLLAALALSPRRAWAPVAGMVLLANGAANLAAGNGPWVSAGFAAANVAEALLAAALLCGRAPGPVRLHTLRDLLRFVALAAVGSNAVTALLGAAVPALAFGADFWSAWRIWWVADGLGMLVVGGLLLIWADAGWRGPLGWARGGEALALVALLGTFGAALFLGGDGRGVFASPYLVLPLIMWAALRFGPRGASAAIAGVSAVALLATLAGSGPFAALELPLTERVLRVQVYLFVIALSGLALAVVMRERREAEARLQQSNAALERRVAERTEALAAANAQLQQEIGWRRENAEREQALRLDAQAAREQLEQVLAGISDQFLALDHEWRYVFVNDRVGDVTGIPRERLLGRSIWELFADTVGTDFEAALRGATAEQRPAHFEYFYPHWGRWFTVHAYPSGSGLTLFIADITERKRAEAALRESEARLSAMLEQLPVGVGMCDLDGRWTLRNPMLDRLTGDGLPSREPAEALRWRSWGADGAPLDQAQWPLNRALRGEAVNPGVEFLHTRADGTQIWTRVSGAPFRTATGEQVGAVCVIEDIDQLKRGEEATRRQSELLTTTLENSTACMFMMDARGHCTYMNRAGETMFGWTFEEIRQRPLHDMIHHHHPDGRPYPMAECPIDRALPENFDIREHEDVFIRRDGEFFPVLVAASPIFDATGRPVSTVIEVRDVTERRRTEAATLRRSEQLRRLAQAATRIHTARDRTATLELVTEEARLLIGAHQAVASTTVGADWAQAINVVSLAEPYAGWRTYDAPTDGSGIYALVCSTNTPMRLTQAELEAHPAWRGFGREAPGHPPLRGWLAVPLVGLDGRNLGLIQLSDKEEGEFTADDEAILVQLAQLAAIALENQALYAQEQAARQEAEEASRLKDEFLATVSHELRTPLTAFLGYAQLLRVRKRDEAYVARTVEKMERSALAQAQLIEDLLDVSRIVSGKLRLELRPTRLIPVVQAALDTARPTVEAKGQQLRVELRPEADVVIGDGSRLQQVVWNLLSNATKFTPAGGTITVGLEPEGAHAALTVSDTGQGISPAFLPHVFDRFRQADGTTNRAHGGLGLGLSIVRHIVELHGGEVRASSAGEGHGSTFTVRLPLASVDGAAGRQDDPPGAEAAPGGHQPDLRGLRVLLVDDQPEILDLLEEILAPCGALVRSCGSAREGLAALRAWRPDVLVSDLAMPGESGYWLIGQVRALPPEEGGATRALALTAHGRVEDRLRVLASGFQQYLPKPVEPGEIRDVIARLARGAPAE